MAKLKTGIVWFVVGVLCASCGGSVAAFPFHYYNLLADSYSGKLEGDKPEHDLDLSVCKPQSGKLRPCQVFIKEEFLRLVQDNQQCHTDLQCWQSGRCHN